jgi:hypothetical protein
MKKSERDGKTYSGSRTSVSEQVSESVFSLHFNFDDGVDAQ